MRFIELKALSAQFICKAKDRKVIKNSLYELVVSEDSVLPNEIKNYLSGITVEKFKSTFRQFDDLKWLIIQINTAIPRVLVFLSEACKLEEIVNDRFIPDQYSLINLQENNLDLRWKYFYTRSLDEYSIISDKLYSCYSLVSLDTLTHKAENDFYGFLDCKDRTVKNRQYIQNLPKLQIIRSFYTEKNNVEMSFQLFKIENSKGFEYILEASWSQDYPAIYISNFKETKIIGELSDSFDPTNTYEVLNYFDPSLGFKPNFFDACYDLYYFSKGQKDLSQIGYHKDNIVSFSHPIVLPQSNI